MFCSKLPVRRWNDR